MKQTLPKQLARALFLITLIGISVSSYTNSGGPPTGNTGAPSETACGGCHGAATTSGTNWNAITLTGIAGNNYTAGQTYTITISGNAAGTSRNGFQVTALNSSNAAAGTFTAGTGNSASSAGGRNYVTQNSSGNTQSSWSFQWTAPTPAVGTVTFYLAYNATNSNSATSGDIVYAKSFAITSGPPAPVSTITSPANAAVFCVGDTVQFTGSATNSPTSFAWDFLGNTPSSSAQQNPRIVLGPNAGSRTVRFRATNAGGTSTNAQIVINVVAKPTATITSSSTVICGSDSVTLTANSGNGFTYFWSPGGQNTQSIKTATPGNYTVRVTNTGNCSVTSAVTTLTGGGPKPQVSLTLSKDTICSSDSVLLTATSGMNYYKYSVNGNVIDSTSANTKWVKGIIGNSVILGVKGYVGVCSSDAAEKLLQINTKQPAPIISCGPSTGSSVSFNIGGNAPQISLDSGKTWAAANQGSVHFISGLNPNTQVYLMARTIDNGPCLFSNTSNRTCAASNCPSFSLQVDAPRYVCERNTGGFPVVKLKVRPSIPLTNPYHSFKSTNSPVILSNGYIKPDSINFQYILSVGVDLQILVSVLDSANPSCPAKDTSITVSFKSKPNINIITNKQTFCQGDSVTFRLSSNLSSVYPAASYFKDSLLLGSNTRQKSYAIGPYAVFPQFADGSKIYGVITDTVSNCSFQTNLYTMVVKPIPAVGFTTSTFNLNIELNDTTTQTVSRSWYMENDSFPSVNRKYFYTFKNAGSKTIKMKGVSSFGCVGEVEKTLQISATGIEKLTNELSVVVYPNPAKDQVSIDWEENSNTLQLKLYDAFGKLMIEKQIVKGQNLDISELPSGVFILQLNGLNKQSQLRLIVGK